MLVFRLRGNDGIDHLRLNRDVEGGHGLVAHDQTRIERECTCDADALALSAGEFVRIALHLRAPQAYALEQGRYALFLFRAGGESVDQQWLAHDVADRHAGIERGERILKDDLHLPPIGPQRLLAEAGNVFALDLNRTGGRLQQAQHRAPDSRLAAAAFADEPGRGRRAGSRRPRCARGDRG
jgi:hypothetical protein